MKGRRMTASASFQRLTWLAGLVIPVLLLSACTSNPGGGAVRAAGGGYPVTVASCGESLTFNESPKRAVANDMNIIEMMLALGLADKMVGKAGFNKKDKDWDIYNLGPPDLRGEFGKVRTISRQYVELEPLLGANPDFFFAGWNYGFSEANGVTPANLAKHGVKTYVLTESCAHVLPGKNTTSLEEAFLDIRNIGAIFNVTSKAEEVIASQRIILAEVAERVKGNRPVRVLFYGGAGEDAPWVAPGLAHQTDLIERAGGVNIFADLRKTWTAVSWEQVAARDPECVIVSDWTGEPVEQQRNYMKRNSLFRNITAVKNDCFLVIPDSANTPGVRNAEVVQRIAKLLHPDRFEARGGG